MDFDFTSREIAGCAEEVQPQILDFGVRKKRLDRATELASAAQRYEWEREVRLKPFPGHHLPIHANHCLPVPSHCVLAGDDGAHADATDHIDRDTGFLDRPKDTDMREASRAPAAE